MWWWYKGQAEFHMKWELANMDEEARNAFFPLIQKFTEGRFRLNEFDREDMVIVGTPDECLEKFIKYDEAGVDQVLCYLNFGYLPHEGG